MAVKSIFNIKCFKDVKFWVEQSVLHLTIQESENIFKSITPPPRVPAKAFACICDTTFYTLYGSGLLAQGGGDVQQPKNPGPKPIKCLFNRIRNK